MTKAEAKTLTLRDVARLAEVSIATVSAVLNRKSTVGAGSKLRVEEAMRRLDFHPDIMARSLKTGRSHAVGLIVPDIANPFFTEAMEGVEQVARSRGYSVILSNSNEDAAQQGQNVRLLNSRRVDGIIMSCVSRESATERRSPRECPIVYFDRVPAEGFAGKSVVVDNFAAARDATRHLVALGHRNIGVIVGRLDMAIGAQRLAGFQAGMQEANLPVPISHVQTGDFRSESGYDCGKILLGLPNRPSAIFVCNNSMTMGLMRALAEFGVACPSQISVVGFDDFKWAEYFRPQLTTVAQPVLELGRQAMRLLLASLEPDSPEAAECKDQHVVLKGELRIRHSTAAPPN